MAATKAERIEMIRIMTENGQHSKWAHDFLDSIIEQLEGGAELSEKQEAKLLEIQRGD